MSSVPTILVCDYSGARAAVAAAAQESVYLRVPFAVAATLGPSAARVIIEQAVADLTGAAASAAPRIGRPFWEFDCGDDVGLALQALRLRVPRIRTAAGPGVAGKLSDIGRRCGVVVISYKFEEEASFSGGDAGSPNLLWATPAARLVTAGEGRGPSGRGGA